MTERDATKRNSRDMREEFVPHECRTSDMMQIESETLLQDKAATGHVV